MARVRVHENYLDLHDSFMLAKQNYISLIFPWQSLPQLL